MRSFLMVAIVGLAALGAAGCASGHGPHGQGMHEGGTMACEACAKGQAGESVWCDHCGAGFVGGQKVTCKGCYVAKTGGPACPKCAGKM